MSEELAYKISFKPDLGGLHVTADALKALQEHSERTGVAAGRLGVAGRSAGSGLDVIATRSGFARQALMGVEMAAKGDTSAVIGTAQALKALWTSFAAGSGVIGIVVLGLLAAYKAVTYFTDKMLEASKRSQEEAESFKKFAEVVNDLRDALKDALAKSPVEEHARWIDRIGVSYDKLAGSVQKYSAAQKSAIQSSKSLSLAKVDAVEQAGLSKVTNNPIATERIKLQAERSKKEIEHQAAMAEASAERDSLIKRKNIGEQSLKSLDITEKDTAGLDQINAERDKLRNLEAKRIAARQAPTAPQTEEEIGRRAASGELGSGVGVIEKEKERQQEIYKQAIEDSQKEYAKLSLEIIDTHKNIKALTTQEEENVTKIKDQKKAQVEALAVLDVELGDNKKLLAQIEDQKKAEDARLAAQEKINKAKANELLWQKDIKDTTAKGAVLARQDTDAVAKAKEKFEKSSDDAEKKKRMQIDPGFKRQMESEEKARAKAEEDFKKKIARAEDSARRGIHGKSITDTLKARDAVNAAARAKTSLEKAQQKQAEDTAKIEDHLAKIQEKLEKAITLG